VFNPLSRNEVTCEEVDVEFGRKKNDVDLCRGRVWLLLLQYRLSNVRGVL